MLWDVIRALLLGASLLAAGVITMKEGIEQIIRARRIQKEINAVPIGLVVWPIFALMGVVLAGMGTYVLVMLGVYLL